MQHIITLHHAKDWDGSVKTTQTFFNPAMSVDDVRALAQAALKQKSATLGSQGTNVTIHLGGTVDGVKYAMVVTKGRVTSFYPVAP